MCVCVRVCVCVCMFVCVCTCVCVYVRVCKGHLKYSGSRHSRRSECCSEPRGIDVPAASLLILLREVRNTFIETNSMRTLVKNTDVRGRYYFLLEGEKCL